MASLPIAAVSSTTSTILEGAIAIVNSESNESRWDREQLILLLAQLAHCPAAPPTRLPVKSVIPTSAPAKPTGTPVPATAHGKNRYRQNTALVPQLLPPTPPLSPTDCGLDARAPLTRVHDFPLSLATCLTLNRSHSISASGLEIATAYADQYDIPRESVLLLGAAQVLRTFYTGLARRDQMGEVKPSRFVGTMENCKTCPCLDYNLDKSLIESRLDQDERCVCGHGHGEHEAFQWEAPKPEPKIDISKASSATKSKPVKLKPCEAEKMVTKSKDKNQTDQDVFAQTADDSFLFETDEEEILSRTQSEIEDNDGTDAQGEEDGSADLNSLNDPLYGTGLVPLVAPKISALPTFSSPGLYQLLKLFCYWTPWTYSGLNHPSSIGQAKADLSDVRACQQCNCADFYLSERWLRRHNRQGSRESLRSLARRQSMKTTAGSSHSRKGSKDDIVGGRPTPRPWAAENRDRERDLAPRPTSRLSVGHSHLLQEMSHSSGTRDRDNYSGGGGTYPSLGGNTSNPNRSRRSSIVSTQSTTSLLSLALGASESEHPNAKCACGHRSSAHVPADPVTDLSWIIVEWSYNAIARLGPGNLVNGRVAWPICADAARAEGGGDGTASSAYWVRGGDAASTIGRRTPSPGRSVRSFRF